MRILIKGGVWKNTEDEILKAAVMKYGKNGWARVASLLNRKSAKQCKARWYEWLDPSIKKTDWSRDEEEKLLHLAKLMPNQWRTIAPIVGRTAAQCMEHYERLLDQAQEQIGEAAEDARKLRPGEIDPAPETKPARPDPIDMDEDEKEMLSEARARLANTKGKKAKRKARERTMAESRRLSMLQKRRELKAAGIESKLGGGGAKKRKYIDFAREIPFQQVPPAGFYDVREENELNKRNKLDPADQVLELSKLEGRHQKEEEEKARQKDQRTMKKLFRENAPLAITQIAAENDPASFRRRVPLSLPTPQVSDGELEEIVKIGQQNALIMAPPIGMPSYGNNNNSSSSSTQSLIADYSSQVMRSLPTPMRTPIQEDIIMQEAKNQRALREMTPFLDVENDKEMPELYGGTGFEGSQPRRANVATPNTFLNLADNSTPLRSSGSIVGGGSIANNGKLLSLTNGSVADGRSVNTTSNRTIIRDSFGLNSGSGSVMDDNYSESGMTSIASVVRHDKLKDRLLRSQISSQLKSLPEPEYMYEVAVPDDALDHPSSTSVGVDDDDELIAKGTSAVIEDAAEVKARQYALLRKQEQEELAKRSSVLKRALPRPNQIPSTLADASLSIDQYPSELVEASKMINEEMYVLMKHDEFKYPVTKSSKIIPQKNKHSTINPIELVEISPDYLKDAQSLILKESSKLLNIDEGGMGDELLDVFNRKWMELHKDLLFIPSKDVNDSSGGGTYRLPKNKSETLNALMNQFAALKARYDKDARRANKIETKLQIITQGYVNRGNVLHDAMMNAYESYVRSTIENACFLSLYQQEQRVFDNRVKSLQSELKVVEGTERDAQLKYAQIVELAKELLIDIDV
jgi:pre-mRNA-splicing factor CDC5/CEF1